MAKKFLEQTISLKTDYADAYSSLGLVYIRLNEPTLAKQNFLRALDLNPDLYEAKNGLIEIKASN